MATDRTVLDQLKGIEESLAHILAMNRLLLAMRILADGHAKNLGEAAHIARDLDRVRELYPEIDG